MNRRESERELFLTDTIGQDEVSLGTPGKATGGEAKPMARSKTQWLGLSGVLAVILGAFSDIKSAAPEVFEYVNPAIILGVIFLAIMLNRYMEARKGEH